jgi:hypothetical protein
LIAFKLVSAEPASGLVSNMKAFSLMSLLWQRVSAGDYHSEPPSRMAERPTSCSLAIMEQLSAETQLPPPLA